MTSHSAPSLTPLARKDLLSIAALSRDEIEMLFNTTRQMKENVGPFSAALAGLSVILLFEKASLRTRISFEVGVHRLGGQAIYMDHSHSRLGERESVPDYGRNLERWVHGIVARVYKHQTVAELAANTSIPVINGLCDLHHPCQALADFFTLQEHFGDLSGIKLAWIGDGNNVCHSLMHAAALLGVDMTAITPKGYEPSKAIVDEAKRLAAVSGAKIALSADPAAVANHHAVYTDVWTSMGQEAEKEKRINAFKPYQVNAALIKKAAKDAVFMHCLPAKRGLEVTDDVIDSPQSIVLDQAENRMHAQNALLLHTVAAHTS